jgi:hypothetical protein
MSLSPIASLIENCRQELGLTRRDVIRRCGYGNIAKGCRRYDELLAGDFKTTSGLLERLPAALEITPEIVQAAIEQTKQEY